MKEEKKIWSPKKNIFFFYSFSFIFLIASLLGLHKKWMMFYVFIFSISPRPKKCCWLLSFVFCRFKHIYILLAFQYPIYIHIYVHIKIYCFCLQQNLCSYFLRVFVIWKLLLILRLKIGNIFSNINNRTLAIGYVE